MVNLWRTRSASKTPKGKKMPYPDEILVDIGVVPDETKMQRRHNREALKFWKRKALDLEDTIEKLEELVTTLEKANVVGDGRGSPASSSESAGLPSADQSSPKGVAALQSCPAAAASPPPSSSAKAEGTQETQRKEEIMQQLVSEMERLIGYHASKIVKQHNANALLRKANEGAGKGTEGVDKADEVTGETAKDANNTSDGSPPACRQMKIETATLEELVSKLLATEKDTSASTPEKGKRKPPKKKQPKTLYQLSCKRCIGQNFVGSTAKSKSELKDKVEEHYAVIWQVVQTAYGKWECHRVGEKDLKHGLSFRASSFAHHAAMHCKECKSKKEVYKWCLNNVKVEMISKHSMNNSEPI